MAEEPRDGLSPRRVRGWGAATGQSVFSFGASWVSKGEM